MRWSSISGAQHLYLYMCYEQCNCRWLTLHNQYQHTSLGIALFGSTVFLSMTCGRSCKQASTISGELYVMKPNPLDLSQLQLSMSTWLGNFTNMKCSNAIIVISVIHNVGWNNCMDITRLYTTTQIMHCCIYHSLHCFINNYSIQYNLVLFTLEQKIALNALEDD